jgi:protein SCO1/2
MKLRTISRSIVIALVVVVGGIIGVHSLLTNGSGQAATALAAGTTLSGKPAPNFQLRDQSGTLITLDSLRGHPVVLTFLDATCTSECPITAQYLNWTAQFLGPRAQDVVWLAMTVNPTNTPAQASDFIAKNHVAIPVHVLLGTQQQLAPLWKAYYIEVIPAPNGGDTEHTIVTYLIDRQGHERELLDQVYDPKLAAQDLRALLAA